MIGVSERERERGINKVNSEVNKIYIYLYIYIFYN